VECKLSVPLVLETLLHFFVGRSRRRTRRVEDP
jgi:hypothetical protein